MPDRVLLVFLDGCRGLHLFRQTVRHDIHTRRKRDRTQRGHEPILIRQLLVVFAVVGQHSVHDETGEKHYDEPTEWEAKAW